VSCGCIRLPYVAIARRYDLAHRRARGASPAHWAGSATPRREKTPATAAGADNSRSRSGHGWRHARHGAPVRQYAASPPGGRCHAGARTRDTPRSRRSVEEAAAPEERRVGLSRPLFLRTDPQTAPRRSMPAHDQTMQRA